MGGVRLGRDFSVSGGLGPNFSTCNGSVWVSQLMGWVGSGHTKLTGGQLWSVARVEAVSSPSTADSRVVNW